MFAILTLSYKISAEQITTLKLQCQCGTPEFVAFSWTKSQCLSCNANAELLNSLLGHAAIVPLPQLSALRVTVIRRVVTKQTVGFVSQYFFLPLSNFRVVRVPAEVITLRLLLSIVLSVFGRRQLGTKSSTSVNNTKVHRRS